MKRRRKRLLSILLTLAMVLGLMPGITLTALASPPQQEPGPGIGYDIGEIGGIGQWNGGTYTATKNETINVDVTVSENATLTINEGVTVTVNGTGGDGDGAISIADGKTLTVTGGGTLEVIGKGNYSGGEEAIRFSGNGTLSVENATVNATGGDKTGAGSGDAGAGIFGSGSVTVNGGIVNAIGGNGLSGDNGFNGGNGFYQCNITVNGGTVKATGGKGGDCTASSGDYCKPGNGGIGVRYGSVAVNSGTLTASGGAKGTGYVGGFYVGSGNPKDGTGINGATISAGKIQESDNNSDWADATGTTSDKRYVKVSAAHTHSFTSYSASGATLTATCTAAGCTLPPSTDGGSDHVATLTISANGGTFDGATAYGATITDANSIQGDAKVQYQKKTDGSYGTATETAPKDAGDYKASITVGGATASVEYTIAKAANPATVTATESVAVGGKNCYLSVSPNGATGEVSYAIDGDANGCTLNGSTLTSGDSTGTVTVNVTVAADDNYEALAATPITVTITEAISLNPSQVYLTEGGTVALTASILPADTADKTVIWSSSDSNVKLYTDAECNNEVGTGAIGNLTVYAKGITVNSNSAIAVTLNANSNVAAECRAIVRYGVTLSGGANAVLDSINDYGGYSSNALETPGGVGYLLTDMSSFFTVVYTANTGYQFPETSEYYKTTSGVTVEKTSDTQLRITGAPTADVSITVPDAVHTHDLTYSASGATITAACSITGCPLTDSKATLTIVKPTLTTYGETGKSEAATLTGREDFNTATGLTVTADSIQYFKATKNGETYAKDDTALTGAPTGAGDYIAEITVSGVKTAEGENKSVAATIGYTIAPATIASVAVTDITAPTATETLDTAATTATEHVTLSSEGAITWDPEAPEDGKAAYATAYTATVTAAAAQNYAFDENVTATVNGQTATVTKNDDGTLAISYTFEKTALTPVTITPADKEVTYSAEGIAIPAEGMFTLTGGAGDATCAVENGTGEGTYNAQTGRLTVTKCGTFTVKVSTAATDTHAAGAETTATLTVNKADPANTVGELGAILGQTLADVALPTAENGAWSWVEDAATTLEDVGMATYHARFTPNDTDLYNTLENVSVSINVSRLPSAVAAKVTDNRYTYDGKARPLVTVDDSTLVGGTMWYAVVDEVTLIAEDSLYSTSIPYGTNPGVYFVWYKVVADDSHEDVEPAYVMAEIGKANLDDLAVSIESWVVGAKAISPSVTGNIGGGQWEFTYKVQGADDSTYTETVPTAVGKYTVRVTVEETPFYNSEDATADFEIVERSHNNTNGETEFRSGKPDSGIKGIADDNGVLRAMLAKLIEQSLSPHLVRPDAHIDAKMMLKGSSLSLEDIPRSEANAIQNEAQTAYGGQGVENVNVDCLDLKVEQILVISEDGVEIEKINKVLTKLDNVIGIPVKYDMTGKTDPLIFRVHDGMVQSFKKLVAKPTEPYIDGTFYVEGEGENAVIYIYSAFFSTYAIVTRPAESEPVNPDPVKPENNPEVITVASLKATGTGKLKLSWLKVKGANYYDVYFGKEGGEPVLLESVGGHRKSLTIKNLDKGTTYVAYVQPWKLAGGEKTLLGNPSPVVYAVTNGSATEVNAKGVYVNNKRMTMMAGTEYTLNGYVKGGAKSKKLVERVAPLRFYSDNINVAEVAPDGTITAVGEGKCLIYTLSNNGMYKATKVMVIDGPTKIRFSKKSINMQAGSQTDITSLIKTSPNNITTPYTLTTDSETVATVDSNGIVTTVGPGRAIITVTTPNNKTAKLTIRVKGGSAVSKGMEDEPTLEIITEDTPEEEQFPTEESAPSIEPEAGETTITLTE